MDRLGNDKRATSDLLENDNHPTSANVFRFTEKVYPTLTPYRSDDLCEGKMVVNEGKRLDLFAAFSE